jgi:hypothetical protein
LSDWNNLFPPGWLVLIWVVFVLVVSGGPLLLRFLNYRPVTRRALLQALWAFVAMFFGMPFGNGAIAAYERGLISLPACTGRGGGVWGPGRWQLPDGAVVP